jgi:phosphate starvation-inducible PhoH-like protein
LNERIIELIDIAPKDFWGAQTLILKQLKILSQIKNVAREQPNFWRKEVLDEFEKRFQRNASFTRITL